MQLPPTISSRIDQLADAGSRSFDLGNAASAVQHWSQALALLPEPQHQWQAWTWLKAAIGDGFYALSHHAACEQALRDALNGPDGQAQAFIHFRLGQSLLAVGRRQEACQALLRAFMLDGDRLFDSDPQGAAAMDALAQAGLLP